MHVNNRSGFTMPELVFVVVIIGILAAVAIPRLSVTRDDAALAKDVSLMAICIKDANSYTLGTGDNFSSNDSDACGLVQCYDINISESNMSVTIKSDNPPGFCQGIPQLGSHLIGTYVLKGHGAKF